uniref:Glutamyl-tRNA(Gln) amidotransferase subunit A n=1 Tax=Magnetococcus massalia (strain MO-1) TaxID=451514 RepID=A0A1S7LMD5_MAGMO|nr:Glutamyl-tRNA(Gln) amidotransferase subunit A (Glu-ADT subunit A) [Candidatus Magnetococcus massalia]
MMDVDLTQLTMAEAHEKLKAKEISSRELTQAHLDRIAEHNKTLNAYNTVDAEGALAAADAADKRIAAGDIGPMTGIPMAHKDIFCTKGLRTTCSSKILESFEPPYDATLTTKLRDAGAVILGKASMDEFAMGSSNETSHFGNVLNPWNTDCTPGGSSGGSASAVAASMAMVGTGTDTGGSIRQPAALTNLTGMKPTYGRCSRFGMIAFASSFDQAGPMARTAEDAAALLQVIAGHDPKDSTSLNVEVPDYKAALTGDIKGLKIGVYEAFFGEGLQDDVRDAVFAAKEQLKAMGAELVPISLPKIKYAMPVYYILATAEASSNLARYDGVKYGTRCENPDDLRDLYFRSRSEGFGVEVKRRIMLGTYVLSSGYYDAFYRKAQQVRRVLLDEMNAAYEKCDVILTPTAPTTAFKLGEKLDDPLQMYLCDIFTVVANLCCLPGISFPCGLDSKGLPIGLQLIGKALDEATLLKVADAYQRETDWHTKRPNL